MSRKPRKNGPSFDPPNLRTCPFMTSDYPYYMSMQSLLGYTEKGFCGDLDHPKKTLAFFRSERPFSPGGLLYPSCAFEVQTPLEQALQMGNYWFWPTIKRRGLAAHQRIESHWKDYGISGLNSDMFRTQLDSEGRIIKRSVPWKKPTPALKRAKKRRNNPPPPLPLVYVRSHDKGS